MTIRDELLEKWPRTPAAIRNHLADYYGLIMHLDAQVGRILEALQASGQAHNTLVIYTSDHGLAVGSHGLMGKENLYEHSTRVPLLMRGPGIGAGQSLDALLYDFDLYATICQLTGVPVPQGIDARGLENLLCGLTFSHRETICCAYRDVQRSFGTARWKYIEYPHNGREQLFDLDSDPHETCDQLQLWRYQKTEYFTPTANADEFRSIADDLKTRLRAWQNEVGDEVGKQQDI